MLISNPTSSSSVRKNHRTRIMELALVRADLDGVPKAAEDFGIAEPILDAWRENTRLALEVLDFLHPLPLSFAKQSRSND